MNGTCILKGKLDLIPSDDIELRDQELNRISGGRNKQSEAKANMHASSGGVSAPAPASTCIGNCW
jgi:hypothetical protein